MNASVQAGPSASAMLAVNAAQAPSDASPVVAGETVPDGGFKGMLEQRMQSGGDRSDAAAGGEVDAQVPVPEAAMTPQLIDSNRIAADAMAAFLASQPAQGAPLQADATLPVTDPLLQAIARGSRAEPTLGATGTGRLDAGEAGGDATSDAPSAADFRAAMDAAPGKRLPEAATDSPATFRALMADMAAARNGPEGNLSLHAGGAAPLEGAGHVPTAAQAPSAPSPGEARTATTQVATPFGRPEWSSAMNERVTWLVGQRVQSADIQLNPPQLGPVEVRITIQDDQANLFFTSQHAAVREAIQAALPRLQEMLAQGGLSLGQTSVGAESFAGQQQASRDGNGGRRGDPDAVAGAVAQVSGVSGQGGLTVLRGGVGVDMFV